MSRREYHVNNVPYALELMLYKLDLLLGLGDKEMAQIDDVNVQLSILQGEETTIAAEVQTAIGLIQQAQTNPGTDLTPVITTLTNINQAFTTVAANLGAVETPPVSGSTTPASGSTPTSA